MIITRTPFRISFFGGGTDLPAWYREHGGKVLNTTIDKYCYVSCRFLPPFFDHKYRVVWSKTEQVKDVDKLIHPVARECIRYSGITDGLELHYHGDLPSRSGLGTSSSFTAGLMKALHGLKGNIISKKQLAYEAIDIEQNKIKETVGSQDQTAAAFGGFNKIVFYKDDQVQVTPVLITPDKLASLNERLIIIFTGQSRLASEIERKKVKEFPQRERQLKGLSRLVDEAMEIINNGDIDDFGRLLNEGWRLKRELASIVSTTKVDKLYERALDAGALGGKLLGAGGGGFLLLFVPPERQSRVREKLGDFLEIPFNFDNTGSQIIFYQPEITKV